jgi:hypothetical protein
MLATHNQIVCPHLSMLQRLSRSKLPTDSDRQHPPSAYSLVRLGEEASCVSEKRARAEVSVSAVVPSHRPIATGQQTQRERMNGEVARWKKVYEHVPERVLGTGK